MDLPNNQQAPKTIRIGKYAILEELGRGGMGEVFLAQDDLGRQVAIKKPFRSAMEDGLARFKLEARASLLSHPNIPVVYEMGTHDGLPFIAMEFVDGDPLDKLIASQQTIDLITKLSIIEQVCSGLGHAHEKGVIHRDIKPANVILQRNGVAKIIDFGIAKIQSLEQTSGLTQTSQIIGSLHYIAPERFKGDAVDGRADIFSAGVILYLLLTGQLPFSGTEVEASYRIVNEAPLSLGTYLQDYPSALDAILDLALAKIPGDRYSTAYEMAADLNNLIGELKLEQAHELLPEARHLIKIKDFTRARTVLQQLLRLQRKNAEAREMMAEIQRHFTARELEEKIQQLRLEAEEALNQKQFDLSLQLLRDALALDTENADLLKLIEKVERDKSKQERINSYLRQADSARRAGDYRSAIAAGQKALKADKSNSQIIALCNLLIREAEQAERRERARVLLDSVRSELGGRRFVEAIALLNEAELLDPTNPELPLLRQDANAGQEQLLRKERIAKLEDRVALATSYEQLQEVAQSIQDAMTNMPAEAALLRLNAAVQRQIQDQDKRRLADDTVLACRDLRPREALEVVRQARLQLPADERLLSLERLLDERVRQQSADERLDEYLTRARASFKTHHYGEAIRVLEMCQTEGLANEEAVSLLEFARHEETEQSRIDFLQKTLTEGQSLIRDELWDEAIELLEATLKQTDDPAIHLQLKQASTGRDSFRSQVEKVLISAGKFEKAGKHTKAIHLLESQSPVISRSNRILLALALLQEEQQQAVMRMVGRAYSLLETDLVAGQRLMRRLAAASGSSPLFQALSNSFGTRAQAHADRVIAETMIRYQGMLRNRDKSGAGELAQAINPMLDFASPQVKADWRKVVDEIPNRRLLKRLRKE